MTGYAINLPDGKVKVVAEGSNEDLLLLSEELKKGPPLSWIETVEVSWGEYRGRFKDFSIRFYD